ncbi:MAG: shikimate kinase [Anaerolineae bacterium]|nr:shikimate kinase [Anaerolineae bacterium]
MDSPIILIGPMSAGKSTIGELLAQKLNLPQHSLDEKRWDYYAEIGYDTTVAAAIANSDQGKPGLIRYWKPFEAHAVERMLADYSEGIIDFGAGHSVYEDEQLFARVQQALAPYDHIILLLPSPDLDESVAILNARFVQMLKDEGVEEVDTTLLAVNEQFVRHPSNHRLATMVIYTKDKTPEESCAEIIQKLGVKGIGL